MLRIPARSLLLFASLLVPALSAKADTDFSGSYECRCKVRTYCNGNEVIIHADLDQNQNKLTLDFQVDVQTGIPTKVYDRRLGTTSFVLGTGKYISFSHDGEGRVAMNWICEKLPPQMPDQPFAPQ